MKKLIFVLINLLFLSHGAFASENSLFVGVKHGQASSFAHFSKIDSLKDYTTKVQGDASVFDNLITQFFAVGGKTTSIITLNSSQNLFEILPVLEEQAGFNLISIPVLREINHAVARDFILALIPILQRKGAMLVLDLPMGESGEQIQWLLDMQLNTKYIAAFYPDIKLTTKSESVIAPPSGVTIAMLQKNDREKGIWEPLVSFNSKLKSDFTPDVFITEETAKELAEAKINVWSQRRRDSILKTDTTLSSNTEETLSQTRFSERLKLEILEDLAFVAKEKNDEKLWHKVRAKVDDRLMKYWRQRAFAGFTASSSLFVRCGVDTIPRADREAGIVNVVYGYTPTMQGNFVVNALKLKSLLSD